MWRPAGGSHEPAFQILCRCFGSSSSVIRWGIRLLGNLGDLLFRAGPLQRFLPLEFYQNTGFGVCLWKLGDPPSFRSLPEEWERNVMFFKLYLTELPNAGLLTHWLAGRKRDWGVWMLILELIILDLPKNYV